MPEAIVFKLESEFRSWFERNLDRFGVKRIILSQEVCPDYVLELVDGRIARVEAELFAINFRYHGHDPARVDLIVACYSRTDSIDGVPVIAANKLWEWEPHVVDALQPDGPLSADELRVLTAIDSMGSVSLSALSDPFPGTEQLWLRLSPATIAAFPRGKDDSLMSVMSPDAKKFIKKHHHALLAAGISSEACLALTSLRARGLISYRPISYLAAFLDGGLLDAAWLPTEVFLTPMARELHGRRLRHLLFATKDAFEREAQQWTAVLPERGE